MDPGSDLRMLSVENKISRRNFPCLTEIFSSRRESSNDKGEGTIIN